MTTPRRCSALLKAAALVVAMALPACGSETVKPTPQVGPVDVDHPVEWFPLDDPAALGRDRSGFGRDARPVGLSVSNDPVRGPVAHFDGGSLVLMTAVRRDLTVSLWIKTTTLGPDQPGWVTGPRIVDADVSGAAPDFGVGLTLDKLALGSGHPDDLPADRTALVSQVTVADGLWHHVAVTRDGDAGSWHVFIDGVPDGVRTGFMGDLTLPETITLGGRGMTTPVSPPLNADLSDVRFYDRVLGAPAIAFLATR